MAWPTKADREARKARMAITEAPKAEAPAFDMSALVSLITDLAEKVEGMEKRLEKQAEAVPSFRAVETDDPRDARARAFAEAQKNQVADGTTSYPVTSTGERVDTRFMKPRFARGSRVRIAPHVHREGHPCAGDPFPDKYETDSKGTKRIRTDWRRWSAIFPEATDTFPRDVVWGDILKAQRIDGEGVVLNPDYLSKTGYWKFNVQVKGLTGKNGEGFYDYELEKAS